MRRDSWLLAALVACVSACDAAPPPTDDGGPGLDGSGLCAVAADCDDGTFCNGAERCDADDPDADERGCAPASEERCEAGETCDEARDACGPPACADADGDGERDAACGGLDCDDTDPIVHPGATEICDTVDRDEDCDPATFGFRDVDGDTHPDAECCNPTEDGPPICGDDCNDARPSVYAGLVEACDGTDNDCDGATDEGVLRTFYRDSDGDDFGDESAPTTMACVPPPMHTETGRDCDDARADVSPVSPEICDVDRADENCDGTANPDTLCRCEGDVSRACALPGRCAAGTERCVGGSWGACSITGIAELCNAEDDDCDGRSDEGTTVECYDDADDDLHPAVGSMPRDVCPAPGRGAAGGCPIGLTDRAPVGAVIDCDDAASGVYPGAPEVCDGARVDEDCDGIPNPNPPCACSGMETRPCSAPGRCAAGVETCAAGAFGACSIAPETEACNGLDDDCDGTADDGVTITCYVDEDNDTYPAAGASMAVCPVPGRMTVGGCPPGLTNRAPGAGATDCDDARSAVFPGATELCDAARVDENCDGMANPSPLCACSGSEMRSCPQPGRCASGTQTCASGAWGLCSISPEVEACNLADDDCDTRVDEGTTIVCYADADNDTYSPGGATMNVCPVPGRMSVGGCPVGLTNRVPATGTDCDDTRSDTYPGAPESCAGTIDEDCDGTPNDGCTCTLGATRPCMRLGVCAMGTETCSGAPAAWVCDRSPAAESCNGADDDCDGMVDDGVIMTCWADGDGDGYAAAGASSTQACACPGGTTNRNPALAADCDDADLLRSPGIAEVCNARDDDCDTMIDDGLPLVSVYFDVDGDLRAGGAMMRCAGYPGSAASSTDCNEADTSVFVGAPELCDRKDNDCSATGGTDAAEDADADGFAPIGGACVGGPLPETDCDDADATDNPAAAERCGGGDNDCDGMADEDPAASATCTATHATAACVAGACAVISCDPGWSDCDRTFASGCEVDLMTTATHCSACGVTGRFGVACVAGECPGLGEVTVGRAHACARRSDGRVLCWGANASGQLGDGTTTARSAPVEVSGLTNAIQIAAGGDHTCARRADNSLVCWGANTDGQLGIAVTGGARTTPQQVVGATTGFLANVSEVATGTSHTCARISSGEIRCWGLGSLGRLGHGSTGSLNRPSATVTGLVGTPFSVVAGGAHTCAATGSAPYLHCWGSDASGQLGDGTAGGSRATAAAVALPASGLTSWADVAELSLGASHTCAIAGSPDEVWCWGSDASGQLGDDSALASSATPVIVSSLSFTPHLLMAGDDHTCLWSTGERRFCWGENGSGQLGLGTTVDEPRPRVVDNLDLDDEQPYRPFDGGGSSTCVLRETGQVTCFGSNASGELGNGTTVASSTPVIVSGTGGMTAASTGATHGCARRDSGEIACWGEAFSSQLGGAINPPSDEPGPVGQRTYADYRVLNAGVHHTCAIRASGGVVCWGLNANGQLGNGTTTSSLDAVTPTTAADAVTVAGGLAHTCISRTTGAVSCWGANTVGQLGDGTMTQRLVPTTVPGLTGIAEVVAGGQFTCARARVGTVSCWGSDSSGQLGNDGVAADSTIPVPVSGISRATDIAAGTNHACALLATGEIRCWGAGGSGRLGDGSTSGNALVPVTVSGTTTTLTDIVEIWAGALHTCGRRVTGQVMCWGANASGSLGIGSTLQRPTPTAMMTITDAISGDAGDMHTCVVRATGAPWCVGEDGAAQLGDDDGTLTDEFLPVPVARMP